MTRIPLSEYIKSMARTKTTHDVFSAIGEPRRRELIELLVTEERSVSELVDLTHWPQPTVSKHLGVLKQVGIVKERKDGRSRIYCVQPEQLQPIQDWIHSFEAYWGGTLDQLENYIERIKNEGTKS